MQRIDRHISQRSAFSALHHTTRSFPASLHASFHHSSSQDRSKHMLTYSDSIGWCLNTLLLLLLSTFIALVRSMLRWIYYPFTFVVPEGRAFHKCWGTGAAAGVDGIITHAHCSFLGPKVWRIGSLLSRQCAFRYRICCSVSGKQRSSGIGCSLLQ